MAMSLLHWPNAPGTVGAGRWRARRVGSRARQLGQSSPTLARLLSLLSVCLPIYHWGANGSWLIVWTKWGRHICRAHSNHASCYRYSLPLANIQSVTFTLGTSSQHHRQLAHWSLEIGGNVCAWHHLLTPLQQKAASSFSL